MKKLLIAGGLCGTTMLAAGDKLVRCCRQDGIELRVTVQNLWETTYVAGSYDLIIEMFPFFEKKSCPVISGKPFIHHMGEQKLVEQIVSFFRDGTALREAVS